MPVEFPETDDTIELTDIVTVLDDPACRKIISTLEDPMTVAEIADTAELPLSTTYKKLDKLSEASLVIETTSSRRDRYRKSRYVSDFERIAIRLDDEQDLRVTIDRSERNRPDIWSDERT